ncbi:MAG: TonB C-terminal domain-containing protein [Deltaproteobacteria bacterium]|nr:TonB C-terminal domain-containing protein [Deltaproteobacteria bacterium]
MQPAHVGITRTDLGVGAALATVVHVGVGFAMWLAPATDSGAVKTEEDVSVPNCAAVVSTACLAPGERATRSRAEDDKKLKQVEERRCPEPVRRALRRDLESPPAVEVDLLQAELVAAKGVETGTVLAQPAQVQKPAESKPKLAEAMGLESKLGDLLDNEPRSDELKKKKLGDILGKADGSEHGEGKVNRSGSAYVREVESAVRRTFRAPAGIPPWELVDLEAKVRIVRMTAAGAVLEWKFDKKSGNDNYDDAIAGLMNGYKSGMRSLPEPPAAILEQINSRGLPMTFRGARN